MNKKLGGVAIGAVLLCLLAAFALRGTANRKALLPEQTSPGNMRTDLKKDLDPKPETPPINYEQRVLNASNGLDVTSEKSSDDRALLAKLSRSLKEKEQALLKELVETGSPILDPAFMSMSDVVQPQQLQARKDLVRKHMAANEKLFAFLNNFENIYIAEMQHLHVSPEGQAEALRAFRENSSVLAAFPPKTQEADRQMDTALLEMFSLLEANWGGWKRLPDIKKLSFDDPQIRDKYNSLLSDMDAAAQKNAEIQRQFVAAQNKEH